MMVEGFVGTRRALSASGARIVDEASQARNLYISFVLKFLRQQALRPRSGNFLRVLLRGCSTCGAGKGGTPIEIY